MGRLRSLVDKGLRRWWGLELSTPPQPLPLNDIDFSQLFAKYQSATMVAKPAALVLYNGVRYVLASTIPGAIVECGVYKGGLCGMAAEMIRGTDRHIYLFDTFAGMPKPTTADYRLADLLPAMAKFQNGWCEGPLEVVRQTMATSGLAEDQIHYVVGKVEDTLPQFNAPDIALLRLDTDFYDSTKAELEHLYDKVAPGGVVIVDDYSIWAGSRKAVDEFLATRGINPFMNFEPSVGGLSFVKP